MSVFSVLIEEITNFLFPKSQTALRLEKLSSGELLVLLPPAPEIKEQDILVLFDYRDPLVKDCIWEIKYNGNKKLAAVFGEILADLLHQELAERALFENFDQPILVPMPISDKRRNERGWNQTEILAKAIIKNDSQRLLDLDSNALMKERHTESQTKTNSKRERLSNLKDSMNVKYPEKIKGRNAILLDDVTTTGATFKEARRALRAAGAKKILCLALAH